MGIAPFRLHLICLLQARAIMDFKHFPIQLGITVCSRRQKIHENRENYSSDMNTA